MFYTSLQRFILVLKLTVADLENPLGEGQYYMDEGHQHPLMDCWGSGEVCYII